MCSIPALAHLSHLHHTSLSVALSLKPFHSEAQDYHLFLYQRLSRTGCIDSHPPKQSWYRLGPTSKICRKIPPISKVQLQWQALYWMPWGREEKEPVPLGPLSLFYKGCLLKTIQGRFVGNTDELVMWKWKFKWDTVWLYKPCWEHPTFHRRCFHSTPSPSIDGSSRQCLSSSLLQCLNFGPRRLPRMSLTLPSTCMAMIWLTEKPGGSSLFLPTDKSNERLSVFFSFQNPSP